MYLHKWQKLFKGGNYSKAEIIRGNRVFENKGTPSEIVSTHY